MAPKLFTIQLWRNPRQYPEQGMNITLTMVQTIIVMLLSLTQSRYVRKGAGNPIVVSRKTFTRSHPKYVPDPLNTL